MDHSFYEELCRRKHPAARWWVVGDVLYYLGLIPACVAFSAVIASPVAILLELDRAWDYLVISAVALPFLVGVWLIGGLVKRRAYVLAERDGIPADTGFVGQTNFALPPDKADGIVEEKPDQPRGDQSC